MLHIHVTSDFKLKRVYDVSLAHKEFDISAPHMVYTFYYIINAVAYPM